MAKAYRIVYPNLVEQMKAHSLSYQGMAALLGLSVVSLILRLRGGVPFKLDEVVTICRHFDEFDVETLFSR